MIATPSKNLFMSVWVGHAVGASALFVPLMLVFAVPSMAAQSNIGIWKALGFVALIPVITTIQGRVIGGFVSLGLWLVSKVRSGLSTPA